MNYSYPGVKTVTVNTNTCGTAHHFLRVLNDAIDSAPCKVKALVLRNMSSSFGECYPQEFLEVALKFCQQRRIHFISDEVYALTSFSCAEISDPVPFVSALALNARALGCDLSRIHTIWSISKDFGATGVQVVCQPFKESRILLRTKEENQRLMAPEPTGLYGITRQQRTYPWAYQHTRFPNNTSIIGVCNLSPLQPQATHLDCSQLCRPSRMLYAHHLFLCATWYQIYPR